MRERGVRSTHLDERSSGRVEGVACEAPSRDHDQLGARMPFRGTLKSAGGGREAKQRERAAGRKHRHHVPAPQMELHLHPSRVITKESRMTTRSILLRLLPVLLPLAMESTALAANPHKGGNSDRVRPGEFLVEPTTLINAGFEWYVDGDDNHNATVEVWYRPAHGNSR